MEPQQNSKKGTWLIILLVLVLIAAGVYYWAMMPQTPDAVSNEVQAGLDSADLGDLESDIQALDTDLNQL